MSWNFQQIAIFHLWAKAIPLLNPLIPVMLWKINIKKQTNKQTNKQKNTNLNGHVWKTRADLESRLTFSEILLNFLQRSIICCTLYSRRYTAGVSPSYNPRLCCQQLAGLKGLMNSQKKFSISSFFSIFLEMSWTSQQISIFQRWPKAIPIFNDEP